jgi:hypothetical protein
LCGSGRSIEVSALAISLYFRLGLSGMQEAEF